ncbi:MAG: hypothetical protein E5X86_19710 [Mesorhizobium sp.]|uniref:hypothetical protein n=1 Tax=Mesorhizobium sp. TaxID=1871066 RepID=UPI001202A9F0|nr:hypothetical protein [Mesorhizobium sp.]TIO15600.1 MAG: hypothetical protein E5X86_19710 [Mesorhizobium sp.]
MTDISEEEILAARSPKGAWTKKTLAQWGVPWPPPSSWKATILAHGIPYDAAKNVVATAVAAEEFDTADLLRKVVVAVINQGQGHILYDLPDVLAFFGSRIPERHEVSHLHGIDERMFEAAARAKESERAA